MYVTFIFILLGITFLLGGIFFMRLGLEKLLLHRLKFLLRKLTQSPWRSVLLGTCAAALMQSSTTVSLLTIGLVSADYLSFYQGLGIILGANIGTCSTVQLMTLSLPTDIFLPLLLLSLLITLLSKRFRYVGIAISGLLSMFLGLMVLSDALGTLSEFATFIDYIVATKENSLYGILGGILMTLLFQSSSAATGIIMVLANENMIDVTTASFVVYGNNIGSCISSIIVGFASTIAAKRLALAHVLLNILGVLLFMPFTGVLTTIATYLTADFAGQVAIIHTLFNIISSLIVLPIIHQYANLIIFLIPGGKKE